MRFLFLPLMSSLQFLLELWHRRRPVVLLIFGVAHVVLGATPGLNVERDQRDWEPYLGQARADTRAPEHDDPHDVGPSDVSRVDHAGDVE